MCMCGRHALTHSRRGLMSHADAEVVICGETGGSAKLMGGGRPGDVSTPAHWNVTVCYVLRKLVPSWIARGFGYVRSGQRLLLLVWADDFTLIASSIMQLQVMLGEFQNFMLVHGIQLKSSKSFWMAKGLGCGGWVGQPWEGQGTIHW